MSAARSHAISRFMDALPGWLCLVGGAVLLGLFTLTPQWLACREVAWHRDLMQLQAEAIEAQLERYRQFHLALAEDDPVLIERLAFAELRRKPVGQDLIDPDPGVLLAYQTHVIPDPAPDGTAVAPKPPLSAPGSVHAWLQVPMPVVGRDIEPLRPIETHVTRITSGPFRLVAVVAAVGVMAMGVLFQVREPGGSTRR